MNTQKPAQPTVSLKCRNPKCKSITAIEIPYQPGTRLYRCVKCNNTWTASVGGSFTLKSV
jgi:DNA-directed RNA polymerase subunit M/transcription elongation factor TFIIS